MKTITEFDGFLLNRALAKKKELADAQKTPEETTQELGAAFKLEGDKFALFLSALEIAATKPQHLKRVVVYSFAEGEKALDKIVKKDDKGFLAEFFFTPQPKKPRFEGRDKKGGKGRGKNPKGRGGRENKEGRGGDERRNARPRRPTPNETRPALAENAASTTAPGTDSGAATGEQKKRKFEPWWKRKKDQKKSDKPFVKPNVVPLAVPLATTQQASAHPAPEAKTTSDSAKPEEAAQGNSPASTSGSTEA